MQSYFSYAAEYGFFDDDKIISKKVIEYGDKKVGFVFCNTDPLSLLDGNAEDTGNHYLSDLELKKIEDGTDADINILVLHHSIEWLRTTYKEKLRKSITKRYSLVLSGHEHSSFGQSSHIDNSGVVQFVQGNALQEYTEEGNGFCMLTIDVDDFSLEVFSYIWNNSLYLPNKIIDSKICTSPFGGIELQNDFQDQIIYDSCKRKIDDYYVFPGVTYKFLDENNNIQRVDIDDQHKLFSFLDNTSYTVIPGEHKSGKSLIAKRIFKYFYDNGKKPLLIEASNINKRKVEKTIDYVFQEEYKTADLAYEKYKQLDKSQRIAIIDEANMLFSRTLDTLINFLEKYMSQIIVCSEENINLNVRNQVVETLVDEHDLNEINMISSSKIRSHKNHKVKIKQTSILKNGVIYGANAAGKSNLVEFFDFFKWTLYNGMPLGALNLFCRNKEENKFKETEFELTFTVNDKFYAYGYKAILSEQKIVSEWLFELKQNGSVNKLFERFEDCSIEVEEKGMTESEKNRFNVYKEDFVGNENRLFLSEMNRNKKIEGDSKLFFFKEVFEWITNNIIVLTPNRNLTNFEYYYDDESLQEINSLLSSFDTGIREVTIKKINIDEFKKKVPKEIYKDIQENVKKHIREKSNLRVSMRSADNFFNIIARDNEEPEISTICLKHGKSFYDFDFEDESDGTRRIFGLIDMILSSRDDRARL